MSKPKEVPYAHPLKTGYEIDSMGSPAGPQNPVGQSIGAQAMFIIERALARS